MKRTIRVEVVMSVDMDAFEGPFGLADEWHDELLERINDLLYDLDDTKILNVKIAT